MLSLSVLVSEKKMRNPLKTSVHEKVAKGEGRQSYGYKVVSTTIPAVKRPPIDLEKSLVAVVLLGIQACTLASFLPGLNLTPGPFILCLQLVITSTKLSDGLFREELLQGPLLDILSLVFLELSDEGNCTL